MALFPLFWDVRNNKLVQSEADGGEVKLPDLYQEDGMELALTVLKRISSSYPFFEKITVSGYDLVVSVGTAGTVNAQKSSGWTLTNNNTTYTGNVDLATAEISALADGTEQFVELKLNNGTINYRGQFKTRIYKSVATAGALVPVAGDTALSTNQAKRLFVLKEMDPGEGIIWQSPSGRKFLEYVDDAGAKQFTEIT